MAYHRRTLDKKESGTVIADFEYELDKAVVRLSMKDKADLHETVECLKDCGAFCQEYHPEGAPFPGQ
jgi:hypothetical protein